MIFESKNVVKGRKIKKRKALIGMIFQKKCSFNKETEITML